MQPEAAKRANVQMSALSADRPDDPDVDSLLGPAVQRAQHLGVGDLGIVEEQLFLGPVNEREELLAGVDGADDEPVKAGFVRLSIAIRLEQLQRLLHEGAFPRDDREAAAMVDIEMGEVEGHHEEQPPVDDQHLVVIAREVVRGPRHGHTRIEQTHLELAEALLAAVVGVGDKRGHRYATLGRVLQCRLDLGSIESEDDDVDALLRLPDRRDERRDAVLRLNEQLHRPVSTKVHGTPNGGSPSVQKGTDREDRFPYAGDMTKRTRRVGGLALSTALALCLAVGAFAQQPGRAAVIWHDRGDAAELDLVGGPGGQAHEPGHVLKFIEESETGTSPKFEVEDEHGVRWKVKLGEEARSETAATRLLWAAGYVVDEDYYRPGIRVVGLPRLARGQEFVTDEGIVTGARLERQGGGGEEAASWSWHENPFVGTR